jgi:hypothetical protein
VDVSGAHPLLGELTVVDQPDLAEPGDRRAHRLLGHGPPAQGLLELVPAAGAVGEQAQADGARDGQRVGLGFAVTRAGVAAATAGLARAAGARTAIAGAAM